MTNLVPNETMWKGRRSCTWSLSLVRNQKKRLDVGGGGGEEEDLQKDGNGEKHREKKREMWAIRGEQWEEE